MPSLNPSPAVLDLGLGADLRTQLEREEEERKKKLLQQARSQQSALGALGPATQLLYGGTGGGY